MQRLRCLTQGLCFIHRASAQLLPAALHQAGEEISRTFNREHKPISASRWTSTTRGISGLSNKDDSSPTASPESLLHKDRTLAIAFTCNKCDTRSAKTFSKRSYDHGVVLVRCPGCHRLHLIADHLGWFGDKGFKVEDLATETGVKVVRVSAADSAAQQQLTGKDIIGWTRVEQMMAVMATGDHRHPAEGSSTNTEPAQLNLTSSSGNGGSSGTEATTAARGAAVEAASGAADSGVLEVDPDDLHKWSKVHSQPGHAGPKA